MEPDFDYIGTIIDTTVGSAHFDYIGTILFILTSMSTGPLNLRKNTKF